MTPPPVFDDRNFPGKPSIGTSQSSTCVSSSVQAGLVDQSMPCTPRPDERRSPRIPGPEPFDGKKAKKFGDCQCVMPGRINFSTSFNNASKGSPRAGAFAGSEARISPGFTCASTGNDSRREG